MRRNLLLLGIFPFAILGACSDSSTDPESSGETYSSEAAANSVSGAEGAFVKVVIPEGTYEFASPDPCVAAASMGLFQYTTRSTEVIPGKEFRLAVVQSGTRTLTIDITIDDTGWLAQREPEANTADVSETRFHFEGEAKGRRYDSEPADISVTIDCS